MKHKTMYGIKGGTRGLCKNFLFWGVKGVEPTRRYSMSSSAFY